MIGSLARRLERLTCAAFGSPVYGDLPREGHGLDPLALAKARRDARYFAIGNALRGLLLLPVLYLLQDVEWALYLTAAVFTMHLLLTVVECFRYSVVIRLEPEPVERDPGGPIELPRRHRYFGPHYWETDPLYRWLGIVALGKVVGRFQDWARGEHIEALGPRTPDLGGGRRGAADFVRRTQQAEVSHALAILIDLPPLLGLLVIGSNAAILMAGVLVLDFALVLLQRHHRVRLRRLFRAGEAASRVQ